MQFQPIPLSFNQSRSPPFRSLARSGRRCRTSTIPESRRANRCEFSSPTEHASEFPPSRNPPGGGYKISSRTSMTATTVAKPLRGEQVRTRTPSGNGGQASGDPVTATPPRPHDHEPSLMHFGHPASRAPLIQPPRPSSSRRRADAHSGIHAFTHARMRAREWTSMMACRHSVARAPRCPAVGHHRIRPPTHSHVHACAHLPTHPPTPQPLRHSATRPLDRLTTD
jgi:hypothetical protein